MSEKGKKKREKSTFWKDFKAFISRGNIVDLAVAVVVGAAFTAIVNSLVNDIIKPLIALLAGGNFSELVVVLREESVNAAGEVREAITLNYGNLIMAILTFLIDAFVIFTVLRIVRKAQKKFRERAEKFKEMLAREEAKKVAQGAADAVRETAAQEAAQAAEPAVAAAAAADKPSAEELLAEIRDLLRENVQRDKKISEEDKKGE